MHKTAHTKTKPADAHFKEWLRDDHRIVIENVTPSVDGGRFVAKHRQDETLRVEADVLMDTHDKLAVNLFWKADDTSLWRSTAMQLMNDDRWMGDFIPPKIGRYAYFVEAWHDRFGTYRNYLSKKIEANLEVTLEIEEGRILLLETLAAPYKNTTIKHTVSEDQDDTDQASRHVANLSEIVATLGKAGDSALQHSWFPVTDKLRAQLQSYPQQQQNCLIILLADFTRLIMQQIGARDFVTRSPNFPVRVERRAAAFASWYEIFPRSQSGDVHRHGTFDDVIQRLPAIEAMGFDTLYLTPIHPIGKINRKGPNNSLDAGPDDPGSPYAIGSEEGGHDTIHPQLGTWQDFSHLRREAEKHGLEIALDFAIQCAPDHPWLKQHPEWFDWRPDGSIKYAENPPKKYQDIVNVDFYAEKTAPDLWLALRDIVLLWAKEGVRTFRVDNPHTKPLPFWEWMINEVQEQYPDVIFLSEAFTTHKMMNRLAKIGFTQSYTYFIWRNSKHEIIQYMTELSGGETPEFFRPHFFVNTPDINPFYLQHFGRSGFMVRAVLAATMSGLWGISSGFELCEAEALPNKEEFNHSEKYEIRAWDWDRPGNIVKEISLLNRLRKEYSQLQTHLGLTFHYADNEQVLFFSKTGKTSAPRDSLILVAVNLQPQSIQDATLEIPLYLLGLDDNARFEVHDLASDTYFVWQGKWQRVRLDPQHYLFVIWQIRVLKE
jgi:starch synthase (maltosyl-transferring)